MFAPRQIGSSPLLARGRDRLETVFIDRDGFAFTDPLLARGRDRLETRHAAARRPRRDDAPTR